MSFGFGFNQPAATSGTTSLLFGSPVTNQTATTKPAFSFGTPATQTSATSTSTSAAGLLKPSFSMGTPGTAASTPSTTISAALFAPASGQAGFSFGSSAFPSATASLAPSSVGNAGQLTSGFSLGTPTTTSTSFQVPTAPTSGFSFGTPAPTSVAIPASTAPTSGFSFGTPTPTSAAIPASTAPISGFSFGTPTPTSAVIPTSTAPTSGFAFGTSTTASTGFPPSTASTSTASMFNFGLFSPAAVTTTTSTSSLNAFSLGATTAKPSNSVITNSLQPARSSAAEGVAFSATSNFNISVANTGTSGTTQSVSTPALSFGKPLSLPLVSGQQTQALPATSAVSFGDPKGTSVSALQSTTFGPQTSNSLLLSKPLSSVASATTIATPASSTLSTSLTSTAVGVVPSVGTAVNTTTSTTATTANLTLPKSSTMTYHQLEDAVNKWAHDLEEQERFFMDEADRIVEWDSTLLKNAEKISTLYEKVNECKTDQSRLEQELDFIDGQQRELEQLLESLERTASELPPGQLHSDFEREAIFQLATNVDLEIGQMLSDMRDLAAQINANNSSVFTTADDDDGKSRKIPAAGDQLSALQQVTRILNCHMHSLNWIHQNTQELMERVKVLDTP